MGVGHDAGKERCGAHAGKETAEGIQAFLGDVVDVDVHAPVGMDVDESRKHP